MAGRNLLADQPGVNLLADDIKPRGKEAKDYAGVKQTDAEFKRDYWQGVRRGANETLYGMGQMINRFAGTPESQRAFDQRTREALPPIENPTEGQATGQVMGNMAATTPLMALPGAASARFLPRAAAAAGGGAAAAVLTPEEDTTSTEYLRDKGRKAAFGATLGAGVQGAATVAGKALQPVINRLSPEQSRLASIFEKQVAPLTAGQATGSKPLQVTESVLENLPGSSARQTAVREAQHTNFTKAVLAKAGIQADDASPATLSAARDGFRQEYTNLAANSNTVLDNQFASDIQRAANRYRIGLKADQKAVFDAKADELIQLAQPRYGMNTALGGEEFQRIRDPLTKQIDDFALSDKALSRALKGLRNSLDDAEQRSIAPELRGVRADLDKRYAIFKTIEDAVGKNTDGQISPVALFNASARRGKGGAWAEGKGELNDLARAGKEFLKPLPDSYTSQRNQIQNLITMGGMGGLGGGAGAMASGGDPTAAISGTALGLLGPVGVQRAMGNPAVQAWLRRQGGSAIPGILGQTAPFGGLLAR